MILDNHENISRKLVTPFQDNENLTKRLSDLSNTTFPTVQFLQESSPLSSTPKAFSSKKNKTAINLFENKDYFDAIFIKAPKMKDKPKKYIQRLNKIFGITENTVNKLSKLNEINIKTLSTTYETKVKKYENLIEKYRNNLSELSVYENQLAGFKVKSKEYNSTANLTDTIRPFHTKKKVILNDNLINALKTIIFPKMTKQFTMTELLIENNLTKSFVLMLLPPEEISFKRVTTLDNLQFKDMNNRNVISFRDQNEIFDEKMNFTFDTHDHGLALEYLVNNAFFYTLANCIDKFKNYLISKKLFDKSLIHIVSEFERTPKHNLAGSDHGFQGHTSTLIGGMFEGTNLTGNIVTNSKSKHVLNNDNGTWGMTSPVKGLGNQTISYRNILNSIYDILKVPKMSKTDASLIFQKNNI